MSFIAPALPQTAPFSPAQRAWLDGFIAGLLGDGPDAAQYKPRPASLAQAMRAPALTDGEIFWKITEGRRPMPGFKNQLSDEQRWQLVNLLRTFPESPE